MTSHATVRLIGAGPVNDRLAGLLLGEPGVARLYLADCTTPARAAGDRGAPSAATRLRDRLRRRSPESAADRLRVLSHWSKPDDRQPTLSVVISATAEYDRAIPAGLRRSGAAHLLVGVDGDRARVGPLVVPGATACLGCVDLLCQDLDPGWRDTVLAAVRRPADTGSAVLVAWAAAQAAVQTLAYLHLGYADVTERTLELWRGDPLTRIRAWPRHPRCDCLDDIATGPGRGPTLLG